MKVAIGGQGSAYQLKEAVKKHLMEKGYEVCDMGQQSPEDSSFFFLNSVKGVAEKVKSGECERGILMCGTGGGVSLAANKIKGIYCRLCQVFCVNIFDFLPHANQAASCFLAASSWSSNSCSISAEAWQNPRCIRSA